MKSLTCTTETDEKHAVHDNGISVKFNLAPFVTDFSSIFEFCLDKYGINISIEGLCDIVSAT